MLYYNTVVLVLVLYIVYTSYTADFIKLRAYILILYL